MITYHDDVEQGTDEWFAVRRGLLTASEMKLIITPSTLKSSDNDKTRAHAYEIAAQRINNYVEPSYISDDMLRGKVEEINAKIKYAETFGNVHDVGFITNDKWGFVIGYSPDWLIGENGQAECKSKKQKLQLETVVKQQVPSEYLIQIQTGLLVSEREWCDYVSYSNGMPMWVHRVYPDRVMQDAIVEAAKIFEEKVSFITQVYNGLLKDKSVKLIPTERIIEKEMVI